MKKACKTVGRGSAPEPLPFPHSPPLPQSQGPCARSSLHAARPHLTYGRVLGPPVPCHPRHGHTSTYGMSREGQNPQGSRRRGPRRGVYKTALTGSEYQDPREPSQHSTLVPLRRPSLLPWGARTPSLTSALRSHPRETQLP